MHRIIITVEIIIDSTKTECNWEGEDISQMLIDALGFPEDVKEINSKILNRYSYPIPDGNKEND